MVAPYRGYQHGGSYRRDYWRDSYRGWWGPGHCDPWYGYRGGLWIGSHWSSFAWGVSLWWPLWHYRSWYWDACYRDCWWDTWSRPYCVSTSYWWYPSTTYCPTYLYVPSTVVVRSYGPADEVEPAPVTTEVVVAGGGVVGSARAGERRDDAGEAAEPETLTAALAAKYVELGDFYFRAERFLDAIDAYGKARQYAPDDASVHFVLADAVFANGDYHYAAFLIGEAIRLDPTLAAASADKRTFYADAKVFDLQLAALERYVATRPYDAAAWLVFGYNLAFSGQPTRALEAFERVLTVDPAHRAATAFRDALRARGSVVIVR